MEAAVRHLHLYKAGGQTHIHTKHFKQWLWEAYPAVEGSTPPHRPEQWQKLVDITQFMYQHGEIPTNLGWTILFLIPKDNTASQGIGIL